jgi:hypothetical protein
MIVLDTNVISEMMGPDPAETVAIWYKTQTRHLLFTTSINCGEMLAGIEVLAPGRRRTELARAARVMFGNDFEGRILVFDQSAAEHYAGILADRKHRGRPIDALDAQIAAVVGSQSMTLATRNTKDFQHCGIEVVNPWSP